MSTFFQPPHGSSGSRTIYTVLHERAQNHNNDTHESEDSSQLYLSAASSSSLSSDSSSGPPSPSRSDNDNSTKYAASSYDEFGDWMDFDATDADQLNAFVPASLGHAIDAARYSSLGDFGTEICWEALPPIFALPNAKHKRHERSSLAEGIDDVPLLSERTEQQQRIVIEYLEEYRSCFAAMEEVEEVAARANLPPAFILYYLSLF